MKKLNHKKKKTLARRMMSKDEIKRHVSPFDSKAWNNRKQGIATHVERVQFREHQRAVRSK